jgi:hypothetical protein
MSYKGQEPVSVDETLRLVATLPAPEGLEARLKARLAAPPKKAIAWPESRNWLRAAAAVLLATAVVGGAWAIYAHVQTATVAHSQPVRPTVPTEGFSSAGAMRTPQTLNGPAVPSAKNAAPQSAGTAARKIVLAKKAVQ